MADSHERDGFHSGAVTARIMALASGSQARILVVDDDELELALVCDRLQSCGLDVRQAANGAQALELMGKEWFPVVVTDWQMPIKSGIEMTEQLRARGLQDTYVIMLTVLDSGFDYERAYTAGVDDYLSKKMPEVELLSRIHAGFSTVNLRRQLREAREKLAELQAK
jgi:DNA-binding response OmpR family regulator